MSSPTDNVAPQKPARAVERLFPFVLRARKLLVGRETLHHRRNRVEFVLITHDLSANSRNEILSQFRDFPIVQRFTSQELGSFFGIHNAKVIGFEKSGLARSILGELKEYRIQEPAPRPVAPKPPKPQAGPVAPSKRTGIPPRNPSPNPGRGGLPDPK